MLSEDREVVLTKISGVSFDGRQDIIKTIINEERLELIREPQNKFDSNAIGVFYKSQQIGFLNKDLASNIAPKLDNGFTSYCIVKAVTGKDKPNSTLGVNIIIKLTKPKTE